MMFRKCEFGIPDIITVLDNITLGISPELDKSVIWWSNLESLKVKENIVIKFEVRMITPTLFSCRYYYNKKFSTYINRKKGTSIGYATPDFILQTLYSNQERETLEFPF